LNIEIKGVQFVNKGAELMLHAVLQQIETYWPQATIVLEPNPLSPYAKRAELKALQKLAIRKNVLDLNGATRLIPARLRNRLQQKWGIVTEADIDLVLDASGFAYGDQWGSLQIRHMTNEIERRAKNGTHYVLLPQALGPFSRAKDRKHLKKALPLASFVGAREKQSYDYVVDVVGSAPDSLYQFPDFTNLVQGFVPDWFKDGENKVLLIPNANMISPKNSKKGWLKSYIKVMCNAAAMAREQDLVPVLLNHEGKGDRDICSQIKDAVKKQSGSDLQIIEPEHPLAVKGIIGASKAVICSRFHGCVSALSQGVPCLGTSWSHKYEELFSEYHRSEYLLTADINARELKELFESCIESRNDDKYQQAITQFKEQSRTMWDIVHRKVGRDENRQVNRNPSA